MVFSSPDPGAGPPAAAAGSAWRRGRTGTAAKTPLRHREKPPGAVQGKSLPQGLKILSNSPDSRSWGLFCGSTPQMPPVLAKVSITLKCPATKPQPPSVRPGRARTLLGARNSRGAAWRRKRSALFLAATHLCFPLLRSRAERSENRLWH